MSKMPWLYCPTLPDYNDVELLESELWHLIRSHRRRVGDSLVLFDGKGKIAIAKIRQLERRPIRAAIEIKERRAFPMPSPTIHLASALPKGDRQGLLLDITTQLGLTDFTPLICDRSITKRTSAQHEKWEKILIETCKQCHRPWLPRLHAACTPIELQDQWTASECLALVADAGGRPWRMVNPEMSGIDNILLLVGPEGGFSAEEHDALLRSGMLPLCLSDANLRIEAAAIAIVTLVAR